jgi:hypothetical protein
MLKPDPKVISAAAEDAELDPLSWLVALRLANFTLETARLEMTGEAAVVPTPPRSPASCIFPLTKVVASGIVAPAICAST